MSLSSLSAPLEQLWGTLQCHEAISLILYTSLALVLVLLVPRWLRSKMDLMFLEAVSRKAREKHEKELSSCATLSCTAENDAAFLEHQEIPFSGLAESESPEKDEKDDPDYLAVRDDCCGDYGGKPNDSFVSGRYHI